MNKNDYINDLNKIKTTDNMKQRLMDIANENKGDDSMLNLKHTRIIGLVASIALFVTIGAIVITLGTGKGNNSTTQVGVESSKESTIETTEKETTINHDEQPTGRPLNEEEWFELKNVYDVSKDIVVSVNTSANPDKVIVTITNSSAYLDYDFDNYIVFSHLEGDKHIYIGATLYAEKDIDVFTVKSGKSINISFERDLISEYDKKLEDYLGSNVFGVNFRCLHTGTKGASVLIEEPVRVLFEAGDNNSIPSGNLPVSLWYDTENCFETTLTNYSTDEIYYSDNRQLVMYDASYDVWNKVEPIKPLEKVESQTIPVRGELIFDIDMKEYYETFDVGIFSIHDYVTTKDGRIAYIEHFKFEMEQGNMVCSNVYIDSPISTIRTKLASSPDVSKYTIIAEFFNNDPAVDSITGEPFYISKYDQKNDAYVDIDMKEDVGWEDIGYIVPAMSTYKTSIQLDKLYDVEKFEDGLYRLTKHFDMKEVIVAEFYIKDDKIELKEDYATIESAIHNKEISVSPYVIDVTFKNQTNDYISTGDAFFIKRYYEEIEEYIEVPMIKNVTLDFNNKNIMNGMGYYESLYLDSLYNIDSLEDGEYIITKTYGWTEVVVGKFKIKKGEFRFIETTSDIIIDMPVVQNESKENYDVVTDIKRDLIVTQAYNIDGPTDSGYEMQIDMVNVSDNTYTTGEEYFIQKYDSNKKEYVEIPMKKDACWTAIELEVPANSDYSYVIILDSLYDIDNLTNGMYRVTKKFNNNSYDIMWFTMCDGGLSVYENSLSNNIFCKDVTFAISSDDSNNYWINATFVNISDSDYETGESFYIYKFNEEICEYEKIKWMENSAVTLVANVVSAKNQYSADIYPHHLYDINSLEDGLYKLTKDFYDIEVNVGELIVNDGKLTFCN